MPVISAGRRIVRSRMEDPVSRLKKKKRQIWTGGAAQWQCACQAYARPWIQSLAAQQRRWQGEAAAVITTSAQRSYIISVHL